MAMTVVSFLITTENLSPPTMISLCRPRIFRDKIAKERKRCTTWICISYIGGRRGGGGLATVEKMPLSKEIPKQNEMKYCRKHDKKNVKKERHAQLLQAAGLLIFYKPNTLGGGGSRASCAIVTHFKQEKHEQHRS